MANVRDYSFRINGLHFCQPELYKMCLGCQDSQWEDFNGCELQRALAIFQEFKCIIHTEKHSGDKLFLNKVSGVLYFLQICGGTFFRGRREIRVDLTVKGNERLLNCDPVRCSSPQPNSSGICPHSCHAFCSPVCLLLQRYSVTQCHSIHLIFAKQTFGQLLRNIFSRLLSHRPTAANMSRWPWFHYLEQLSPLACVVYLRDHQDRYLAKDINLIGFATDSFSCFCCRLAFQSEQCSFWLCRALGCFWNF